MQRPPGVATQQFQGLSPNADTEDRDKPSTHPKSILHLRIHSPSASPNRQDAFGAHTSHP